MPRFTLIKHPEGRYDTEVTVTFECEMVDVAKAHYDDFLQGAGFSLPDEAPFERKLTQDDFLAKEEDWQWDDAFKSKFQKDGDYCEEPFISASYKGKRLAVGRSLQKDVITGSSGADVIKLSDYCKEPFIPTFHD